MQGFSIPQISVTAKFSLQHSQELYFQEKHKSVITPRCHFSLRGEYCKYNHLVQAILCAGSKQRRSPASLVLCQASCRSCPWSFWPCHLFGEVQESCPKFIASRDPQYLRTSPGMESVLLGNTSFEQCYQSPSPFGRLT